MFPFPELSFISNFQFSTMSISLTKRNFLYQITLLTLIAGWVGAGILHYLLPGHYFGGYPFIPVYFFLFGLFEISMFDACRKHAPQKMLLLYMAMKVMKMLLSVILLVVYCFAVQEIIFAIPTMETEKRKEK